MKILRILRPEDVVINQPMASLVDPKEADDSIRRAMAATEKLRHFVETRERGLFPEVDIRTAKRSPRRIGFRTRD